MKDKTHKFIMDFDVIISANHFFATISMHIKYDLFHQALYFFVSMNNDSIIEWKPL